jgi:hypothetical protein
MFKDNRSDIKWNGPLVSIPFRLTNRGEGDKVCLNFMGSTNAGRLADEVEACLDILWRGF